MVAGLAEVAFFTLINPRELYLLGEPIQLSLTATYSIGFGAFWILCAVTSVATLFFLRSSGEINHSAK